MRSYRRCAASNDRRSRAATRSLCICGNTYHTYHTYQTCNTHFLPYLPYPPYLPYTCHTYHTCLTCHACHTCHTPQQVILYSYAFCFAVYAAFGVLGALAWGRAASADPLSDNLPADALSSACRICVIIKVLMTFPLISFAARLCAGQVCPAWQVWQTQHARHVWQACHVWHVWHVLQAWQAWHVAWLA